MKCRYCGAEVSEYAVFCTNCRKPMDLWGGPEPKPEPKPEPTPEPKAEPEQEPRPEPRQELKPEPKREPEPKRPPVPEKLRTAVQKLGPRKIGIAAGALLALVVVVSAVSGGGHDTDIREDQTSSQLPPEEESVYVDDTWNGEESDYTDYTEPPDYTEPTETTDYSETTETTDYTENADYTETAETTEPADYTETADYTEPAETTDYTDSYIIPDSNIRYLTEEDLQNLSSRELSLARNEIYARHGRMFKNEEIMAYFEAQSWYQGTIAPSDFNTNVMSEVEIANAMFILSYEKQKFGDTYF